MRLRGYVVATYNFETITPAQALSFNGASDTLVFTSASQTGASERLLFNADGAITVLSDIGGLRATFGPGLAGAGQIIYPDGSLMLVGSPGGDVLTGGSRGDGLFGGFGNDTLIGGGGDDALQGGPGADLLTGGAGRDLFIFDQDSPPVVGQMDTITDWQSSDGLSFFFGPTVPSSYVESTAADFASAKTFANAQIASGTVEYVAVQVGADVIVFADSHSNHGVAGDAVTLAGRTLSDIDASNIVTTAIFPPSSSPPVSPPPVSPPPISPPPPPAVIPGQGVTATISGSGNLDLSQAENLINNGVVSFSSILLSLTDGASSMTLGGSGFALDSDGDLVAGTLTSLHFHLVGGAGLDVTGLSLPAATLAGELDAGSLIGTIFRGNDVIVGDAGSNLLVGGAGYDTLTGGGGADVFEIAGLDSDEVQALNSGGSPADRANHLDHITDWTSSDYLYFPNGWPNTGGANYIETTAPDFVQAAVLAGNLQNTAAHPYVAVQVGPDVIVFGAANAVVLSGRTLNDISGANVGMDRFSSPPLLPPPPPPVSPPPPPPAHAGATVDLYDGSDMGTFQESQLANATVTRSPTLEHLTFAGGAAQMSITGVGLTYDSNGTLTGGTVTGVEVTSPNGHFVLAGAHTDGSILGQAYLSNDANYSISHLLSGDDLITVRGSPTPGADTSFTALGFGGNDLMVGGGSASTLMGGDGNDTVQAGSAATSYLRGEAGDDSVAGGSGFDDINGNQGDDTLSGGDGNDWVVGGKDNDLQFGDAGDDIVWGNLGADTLDGGDGNDQVRGGQGDDSISGGAGNDYISGDRGNDTETGGAGADIFHSFSGAGTDRVLDFHLSEGDRVMLDPGTTFSVTQVGADTVIDMGNGDQLILVGVQASSLPPGTIFLG